MRVSWLAAEPPLEAVELFTAFGYQVERTDMTQLANGSYLGHLAALVLIQSKDQQTLVATQLDTIGALLLNHDCRIILRPNTGEHGRGVLQRALSAFEPPIAGLVGRDIPPHPAVQFYDASVPWHTVLRDLLLGAPGPAVPLAAELIVTITTEDGSQGPSLGQEDDLLVRRAFADCVRVHLTEMPRAGRSVAAVYVAHVYLKASGVGNVAMPFFIKLDSRARIHDEHNNYAMWVAPHVPPHLAPRLALERCCLGSSRGILVGDLVEESELLVSCATSGRAAPAVACLLDRALYGWHRNAHDSTISLADVLLLPRSVPGERVRAAMELGAARNFATISGILQNVNSTPVRIGNVHGDLHVDNILVRGVDGVLIDFLAAKDSQPLLRDPATLEASLFVDGFLDDHRPLADILKSVLPLYGDSLRTGDVPHCEPWSNSFWFVRLVRQLRAHAHQLERCPNQYGIVLAYSLLHKAAKDPTATGQHAALRVGAYFLADHILQQTNPI